MTPHMPENRKPRMPRKSSAPEAKHHNYQQDLIGAGTTVYRERDATSSALLARIKARTADCFSNTPFVDLLARHAGISVRIAGEVISGHKPFTTTMLDRVAVSTSTSAQWLLTGEGSLDPLGPSGMEEEFRFIKAFRNAPPLRQNYAIFMLSFDGVLLSLPSEIRNRVLSGLLPIAESGLEEFEWLVNAIGRCMVSHAIEIKDLKGLDPIFTPVHEVLGIYGPERPASLGAFLSNQYLN